MDFLDGLDEAIDEQGRKPKRPTAVVVPSPPDQIAKLDAVIDRVFDKHIGVLEAAGDWADIDTDGSPEQVQQALKEPPREWVERYGKKEAKRRLRIARAALAPTKDAPVGLKLSQGIVSAMVKAKAKAPVQNTLNVAVFLPSPNVGATVEDMHYPIIDVVPDD